MKKVILLFFVMFNVNIGISQTLTSGNYSSSDLGYTYTVILKHEGNVITLAEPNKVNQYKSKGGNTYYHTETKYSHYYIKVAGKDRYYVGKQGGPEQLFTLSVNNTIESEVLATGIDNCPLYDKYLKLTTGDGDEVQAWAFCGAAALAKCTYTDVDDYLKPIIKGLKSIAVDTSKCPCTDVISQSEWNAVKID
jgi:hypothetical protein